MAGKFTRLQKTYRIGADNVNPSTTKNEVPMYRGVVLSGEDTCKLPVADNAIPLGVVDGDERLDDPLRGGGGSQAGKQIAVKLEGIADIELVGNISVGDRVILGTGGFAKKIPAVAGQYNVIGIAEKSGVDGDVIPVRMGYDSVTVA
jgi:hypothetical protein